MTLRTDSNRKMKKTCSNCVNRFLCPNNYRVCDGWNNEGLFWGLIKLNFPLPEEFIDEERAFIKLREMNGEPVWGKSLITDKPGEWFIVRVVEMSKAWFIACAGATQGFGDKDTYGTTWLAYRRPPDGEEDT